MSITAVRAVFRSCRPRREPLLERSLTLPRPDTTQQVLDADILIEIRPVDPLSSAHQSPMEALRRRRMYESRIPRQGDRDRSSIDQVHSERVFIDHHARGTRRPVLNRRSTHPTPSGAAPRGRGPVREYVRAQSSGSRCSPGGRPDFSLTCSDVLSAILPMHTLAIGCVKGRAPHGESSLSSGCACGRAPHNEGSLPRGTQITADSNCLIRRRFRPRAGPGAPMLSPAAPKAFAFGNGVGTLQGVWSLLPHGKICV